MKKYVYIALSILFILCCVGCSGSKEVVNLTCTTTIGNSTITGLYSGAVTRKQPHGFGTFTYLDDSIAVSYSGNWESGIPSGKGHLRFDGFDVEFIDIVYKGNYEGEALDGFPSGQGNFTYFDDSITVSYTGNWENGIPSGEGYLEYSCFELKYDDTIYEGKYEGSVFAGIPNGNGTFSAADESLVFIYSGEWENGNYVGTGELEFSGLTVNYNNQTLTGNYTGEIVDGIPCGMGEFHMDTGRTHLVYSGGWKDGYFSGFGTIDTNFYTVRFTDGIVRTGIYIGEVIDGIASGEGSFTAENSSGITYTHDGEWRNGLPNGYGCRKFNSPDYYIYKGNFVEGNFTPTPLEYFIAEGTLQNSDYTIIDKAVAFLQNNPELFLTNDLTLYEGEFDKNFQYKAFSKNQSQYGDKLIVISGYVVQISEGTYWGDDHTFCLIRDGSYNYYYVHMYGFAENIYDGSWVTMTALPLDYFTYRSVSGNDVWAIACAAVSLE